MTNEELKHSIIDHILPNDLLILQWSDTTLVANQYAEAIANNKDLEVVYISELDDINSYLSPLDLYCPYLFIMHTDCFDEIKPDYNIYENVIIICKSLDKKAAKLLDGYVVKMDKLEPWHLYDYIYMLCPGLTNDDAYRLATAVQHNPDRIDSIANQIALFDPQEQSSILKELLAAPNTDLYFNTAFNLCDAITNLLLKVDVQKNANIVHEILAHRNCCDITTLYVVTILLAKLRNIAIICYGGKVKASAFVNKDGKSMSDKQYYYFKNAYAPSPVFEERNAKTLSKAIELLASIDSELKTGKIELSEEYFLDYVITSLLAL